VEISYLQRAVFARIEVEKSGCAALLITEIEDENAFLLCFCRVDYRSLQLVAFSANVLSNERDSNTSAALSTFIIR
jgi:hypothetical protein